MTKCGQCSLFERDDEYTPYNASRDGRCRLNLPPFMNGFSRGVCKDDGCDFGQPLIINKDEGKLPGENK